MVLLMRGLTNQYSCTILQKYFFQPFSFLWGKDVTQTPTVGTSIFEGSDLPLQNTQTDTLSIESTHKAIDPANLIAALLINTNYSRVNNKTLIFACALTLSSLVHISANIWSDEQLTYGQKSNDAKSMLMKQLKHTQSI